MTAELSEALTPLVGSPQASSMASSLAQEQDPLKALRKIQKKLLTKTAPPLYPLVRTGQILLKINAKNRGMVFKNIVDGLRETRAAQKSGTVGTFAEGAAILAAVIETTSSDNSAAPTLSLGSILNFKNFGDNTWKQPRTGNTVILVVDDSDDKFDPFDKEESATSSAKARDFASETVQLIVVIDGQGNFKHLYAREGDSVGAAFAAGAAKLWPHAPPQAFEMVPPASGPSARCGPWRVIDSNLIAGNGPRALEISLKDDEPRDLFPKDILLFAVDAVTAPYGIGRLHHFYWSDLHDEYRLVLDRFSLIPSEHDGNQEREEQ